MRVYELNEKFTNERDAENYLNEIWFDYRIMGKIYVFRRDKVYFSVEFEEDEGA